MCLPQTNRIKLPSARPNAELAIWQRAVYPVSAPGERASVLRILTAACASRVCNLYGYTCVLAGVYE